MSYQVLARKWRPRTFEQVVGQVAALRALTNALEQQRVHHAYLFTGTRGVGKTTLARILAKCLNCEAGVSAHPCGVCATCVEIDKGNFADLIEVDAASRSKVEETRELLDNVVYAPVRGRYKIYLIDEVHMLSGHSFNALLKTLEEPPEHVKFLLATTDPQRMPVTVISRCLQFSLTPLTPELIAQQLTHIVKEEHMQAEPAAVADVAQAANGSMRDALSLLDQLLGYAAGKLTVADVRTVLGVPFPEQVCELLQALSLRDGLGLVKQIANLGQQLPDLTPVLIGIIEMLQKIALAQLAPESLDKQDSVYSQVHALAQVWQPNVVQNFYQIALNGRRDLPYAATVRSGLEMILLRMLASVSDAPPTTKVLSEPKVITESAKIKPVVVEQKFNIGDWSQLLEKLELTGMVKAMAEHCVLLSVDENAIQLAIASQHSALLSKQQEQRLQQALDQYASQCGEKPRKLQILVQELATTTPAKQRESRLAERQQQAMTTLLADAGVQALVEKFDATVNINLNKER
jgi:DNA polymerase-3 subunit gamma/tau